MATIYKLKMLVFREWIQHILCVLK